MVSLIRGIEFCSCFERKPVNLLKKYDFLKKVLTFLPARAILYK